MKDRIYLLGQVAKKPSGYKQVVSNSEEYMPEYSLFSIRHKCIFLRAAYHLAREKIGIGKNKWIDTCYNEAVKQVNALGIHTTINANTLSLWNIQFYKLGKFPHPNPFVANGLRPKPLLFEYFPTSSDGCK